MDLSALFAEGNVGLLRGTLETMRKRVNALVLAAACAAACASSPGTDYTFHLDSGAFALDSNAQAAMREAGKQWAEFTNVHVTVDASGSTICLTPGCFNVYETSQHLIDTVTFDDFIAYTVRPNQDGPGLIAISRGMSYDETQWAAVHEMGHALGLVHPCISPCSDHAVMNPTYNRGADHVVCADVVQFYDVRGQLVPSESYRCDNAAGPLDEVDGGPANDP